MRNVINILETLTIDNLDKKLFQFIEYFPTATFLIDEHLVIWNVNKLAESMLTCESENIVGKNIIDFIDQKQAVRFKKILKKTFDTDKPHSEEVVINIPENSGLNVLVLWRCFVDRDTNSRVCVLAILDFSSQKMKEEIIRDSEDRFKTMANTAPVMIWIADVDGLFSFVNNVWLNYSGGEIGDQLGINWLNNVHTDDLENLMTQYQKALKNKMPFSIEFRFKDKNKNFEWMLIKGTPRFSRDNVYRGFIGSCINIHDQKLFEAKISNLNKELIQTIATRDKLFSIIAHDLRSPFSGLMGILDILDTDYESLDEKEKREFISHASVASKTTFSLMENLLEWSRIQTRTIKYQPEKLKIQRLVENLNFLYEQNLKTKEIEINNLIKSDVFVYADKSMTETILRNLITNAIKFTSKGGQISVSSKVENGMAIIQVKDSGVGIEEHEIPNLFIIDSGNSTIGTEEELGSGLGLIICKELVEKQKGRIWVESNKKEGSSFYFSLPISI
jgi:PAS domain S-box-containing protein